MHKAMNLILYLTSSTCAWSLLSRDFPPFMVVQRYLIGVIATS